MNLNLGRSSFHRTPCCSHRLRLFLEVRKHEDRFTSSNATFTSPCMFMAQNSSVPGPVPVHSSAEFKLDPWILLITELSERRASCLEVIQLN